LLIVHVEKSPQFYDGIPPVDEQLRYRDDLLAYLQEMAVPEGSVPYEHRLLVGDPAGTIVGLAEEEHVDLIVMGTHGRTGLSRVLLGSVAEAVVRRASCPVLMVKQPQEVETPIKAADSHCAAPVGRH